MAKCKQIQGWRDQALAATAGTQFGAILHASLGVDKAAPLFRGKASVTSDGFVMCDFVDSHGAYRHSAFVGAVSDLDSNVDGLSRHLNLGESDRASLRAAVKSWIGTDYRSNGV
jgi:hypothetical protein